MQPHVVAGAAVGEWHVLSKPLQLIAMFEPGFFLDQQRPGLQRKLRRQGAGGACGGVLG